MKDRAVSPVIGVVLMVGITIILASTTSVFLFGMVDDVQQSPPLSDVSISTVDTDNDEITIEHRGGEAFTNSNTDELRVIVNGSEVGTIGTPFTAGDSTTISADVSSDSEVRVVWVDGDSGLLLADRKI